MIRMLLWGCLAVAPLFFAGCSHNYYNIPRETYEKKVRVLGVAPIMVDAGSDLRHPEKDALVDLLRETNRKNEKQLVALLKETGAYFSVGLLDEDADQLFSRLFFRRERREDAGILYNKYFFKGPELKDLLVKNTLDAVLLVVVSGQTRPAKLYSSNYLSFLEGDYNSLIMTAQIVDADGVVLWEYPNFRTRTLSFSPLLTLQYPDFDEAEANLTNYVDVKFKTIPGLTRILGQTQDGAGAKGGKVSKVYAAAFSDMISLLSPPRTFPWEKKVEKKEPARTAEAARVRDPAGEAPRAAEMAAERVPPKRVTVDELSSEDVKTPAVR